ncbi:N-acetyltransferase 9 isoform X2 [Triplophysa rosa]|uniref:Alpha/beta-tubulin-N-acetyltransferase 9 n=1 Tax=Triplophysa rosa TaxID=992332 RepID=A0A9W7TH45_TRIRA|nr:N-acetyltransferase 9 isoform X2 [Triplophysa rosa]KAI7796799.1 putative N-acetyltransferase 9 [Triplophysa rosa]
MRINEDTLLEGQKVVLVPYNADHVPRYHQWMSSPDLQKLTASEPLTLEQEYDMQKSWKEDNDKCTFIVLDKQKWGDPSIPEEGCMVGDVNIFLTDPSDPTLAELEIMIAVPCYRGKGLGKEVTRMMMCYGISMLGIQKFEVKIGLDNKTSIAMFKKFHFKELTVSEVFQEVTLGVTVNENVRKVLFGNMDFMLQREYGKARDSRQAANQPFSVSCE